jgi:hypothetical protein
MKRAILALFAALLLAAASITPALAADEGDGKCNSGRGNGQETTIENDCDPGNSGGHNQGGG